MVVDSTGPELSYSHQKPAPTVLKSASPMPAAAIEAQPSGPNNIYALNDQKFGD